jgi:hypothetical protein
MSPSERRRALVAAEHELADRASAPAHPCPLAQPHDCPVCARLDLRIASLTDALSLSQQQAAASRHEADGLREQLRRLRADQRHQRQAEAVELHPQAIEPHAERPRADQIPTAAIPARFRTTL